jgi:hypothetical protein
MLFLVLHLLGDLLESGSRSADFAASLFYNRISRVPKGFAASAFLHQLKCRAYVRFQRLMKRLREIATGPAGCLPVLATPLSG